MPRYIGRFAPSPSGPLHAGSLVAALASWLDARAHGGQWLLRIEDIDSPRNVAGAAEQIVQQLAACGLRPDAAPLWQSSRSAAYAAALRSASDSKNVSTPAPAAKACTASPHARFACASLCR
jgi:glutamyl-Q tRNA(Asp) synthetase